MTWFVYILECADGSFYIGITTNCQKRLQEHNSNRLGSKYTRSRRPVKIVYTEAHTTKESALKREWDIKTWDRQKKMELINVKTYRSNLK